MAVSLNHKGRTRMTGLIAAGRVDKKRSWSDSNVDKYLYLGIDSDVDPDSEDHLKYPFGKDGKVYRSALVHIRDTAEDSAIIEAASAAIARIDGARSMGDTKDDTPEYRTVAFTMEVETRADGDKMLRGHAAVFNQETVIGTWFREVILPGAFVDTISEDDQRALFNHDPNFVLGRKSAGTLDLSEDKKGLSIVIDPPRTQLINDLVIAPIERGDIDQMSFSFRVKSGGEEWERGENGLLDLRKIKKCRVFDVSPVTFPAYGGTDIALRSYSLWDQEQRDEESSQLQKEYDKQSKLLDIKRKRSALKNKEA